MLAKLRNRKLLVVFCVLLAATMLLAVTSVTQVAYGAPAAATRFVTPTGVASGTCTTWGTACTLPFALSLSVAGSGDQIWVAAGTYTPTLGVTRTATFQLRNSVALYGGFVGTETARSQRNWTTHVTILSGDIGVTGDSSDNAYHVVRGDGTNNTAILDGFTITAGNADGDSENQDDIGGGLCNCWDGNGADNSGSPTINNMIFSDNDASYSGAGMFNFVSSSPVISNVLFTGNIATTGYGGGMDNYSHTNPILTNVTFTGNSSVYGGAFSARGTSSPKLTNVLFYGNFAWDGGAIHNEQSSFPLLTHVTIAYNNAGNLGGAVSDFNTSEPDPTGNVIARNSILWGNTASISTTTNEIDNDNITNTAVLTYTDIQGGYAGTGNINLDPQFVNSGANNYRLTAASAAIDAGAKLGVNFDLDDHARDNLPDMGAYEFASVAISGVTASNDSPHVPGASTSFGASVAAGTQPTFQWNFGDGQGASGQTPTHIYTSSGLYTATVGASNGINGPISATTRVTITDIAITGLAASNDSPKLVNVSATFTASISTGTGVSYQWNYGDSQTGSGKVSTHAYTLAGLYTASVTATNLGSGPFVATTQVTITDVPIAGLVASNNSPTRLTSLTTLTATISAGTGVSYQWNFGDGGTGNTKVASHTYLAIGTYTATVTATNSVGGPSVATTSVSIIDTPITGLSAANSSPTQLGQSTAFTASITGGSNISYQWDYGDGSLLGSGITSAHTYAVVGPYTVHVTATNGVSTVVAATSVNIVDTPIVGLSAANSSPTRLLQSTAFTASITSGSNVSYQWNFGDGVLGSGLTAAHTYGAVGPYTAHVTATNSVSTVVAATSVSIIDTPITGLSAANSSPTQLGQSTALTASITGGSNVSYQWDFGDGVLGSGITSAHTYAAVGPYTAHVTATNGVSTVVASTSVSIIDVPISGLAASNNSPTLLGSLTTLTATKSAGTNVVYQWNFGDGQTGSGAVATHAYGAVGIYTAIVTATNSDSGPVAATTQVTINDIAISGLTASNNSPTTLGSVTTLTATTSAGTNVSYHWDFGDAVIGSGAVVTHAYAATGVYTATVSATNGASGPIFVATIVTIVDSPITGLTASNDGPTFLSEVTTLSAAVTGGTNVSYAWAFGDGQFGLGKIVTHTYTSLGAFTAVVTATNSASGPIVATTNVSITNVPDVPIAGLTASSNSPTVLGGLTTLTATISAGTHVSYQWNYGDGQTSSGKVTTHTYLALGVYTAVVTATNGTSGPIVATTHVTITDVAIAGLAAINDGPKLVHSTINFTATISAGSNVNYQWNFGDGNVSSVSSALTAAHQYNSFGSFTAVVTATNSGSIQVRTTPVVITSYQIYLPLTLKNH